MMRYQVIPAAYVIFRRPRGGSGRPAAVADPLRVHGEASGEDPGEVLLQLRRGTGYMDEHWACGSAGHVEAGESVVAAARREAMEELGIEVGPLTALTAMHRSNGTGLAIDERVDFFFECWQWTGDPHLQEADKAAELGWFPLDALPTPVVPHELYVLELLRDGTVPAISTVGFDY